MSEDVPPEAELPSAETEESGGRVRFGVPWSVLLLPFCAPLSFFGEERWEQVQQMPVLGDLARVLNNGVFDSKAVTDSAGVPYDVAFVPTAGLAIFIAYQIGVRLFVRTTGVSPTFQGEVSLPARQKTPTPPEDTD